MFVRYLTREIIKGNIPLFIEILIRIIAIKRNRILMNRWDFSVFKNREWLQEFNIDPASFNPANRRDGISLFARLKNAAEFLEVSIESQISFFDEVILVDNNSSDETQAICKKIQGKYPEKVKFYAYTPEVYPVGHEKWTETTDDSIHCLSYYYNWTLSKTTCKYAAKLDDDIVVYDKDLLKKITDTIRNNGTKRLQIIPQINVYNIGGKLMTPIAGLSPILPVIAWLYCDHWIFPVSQRTYFIKDRVMENFIFPFSVSITPVGFFHLKGLKQGIWLQNWKWDMAELIKKERDAGEYILLPQKYKDTLSSWVDTTNFE